MSIYTVLSYNSEAATGGVVYEKVFLKIPQNSQENTSRARVSFLIKLQVFFTEHLTFNKSCRVKA